MAMNPTSLYLLLSHLALAAHVALYSPPFAALPSPGRRNALHRALVLLNAAAAELRDVMALHGLDAPAVLPTLQRRAEHQLSGAAADAAGLCAVLLAAGPSDITAALLACNIPLPDLLAALPSLRAALVPEPAIEPDAVPPWADLARAEKERADAWSLYVSAMSAPVEATIATPALEEAAERVMVTTRKAIRLRAICRPFPARQEAERAAGEDAALDARAPWLSPMAADPLPRGPDPIRIDSLREAENQ